MEGRNRSGLVTLAPEAGPAAALLPRFLPPEMPGEAAEKSSGFVAVRRFGTLPYGQTWRAMQQQSRRGRRDEFWLLQHEPVYTLGLAAGTRPRHSPLPSKIEGIPVIRSDRGGQITYHGPGQLILYVLVDLARLGFGPRRLVGALEQAVIELLSDFSLTASAGSPGPGIYVEGAKIASLGLRISRGRSLHGLALNVDVDLAPFAAIDPCGFPGLRVTRLSDWMPPPPWSEIEDALTLHLSRRLNLRLSP